MPLLHNAPFKPEPPPSDLKPDEEVFLCRPTQEVFRDYETFFNRYYLCNSLVWTCEYSGKNGLTYAQALASEQETKTVLDAMPLHLQRAILALVHNAARTNMKTLEDEVIAFYRERFVVGEQLELSQATTNGCRSCLQVQVMQVVLPELDKELPPVQPLSVSPAQPTQPIECTASLAGGTPNHHEATPALQEATPTTTSLHQNGLHDLSQDQKSAGSLTKKRASAKSAITPISPEINLDPSKYQYFVQDVALPSTTLQVSAGQLSRPKSVFTREKVRVFMKNALYKPSDRHPIMVKDQYVQKFSLGPLAQDLINMLSTPTLNSEKKKGLAQASLDNFFSPGVVSGPKKSKSLNSAGSSGKSKGSSAKKKTPKGKGTSKKKAARAQSDSVDGVGASTPKANGPRTPKAFSVNALKVLNRAKKMKQLDLKRSVHKSDSSKHMTEAEWQEIKQKVDDLVIAQKQFKKEERLAKLRKFHELKKQEKVRQRELMKPREDLLCEESKPLPASIPIASKLPNELFGQAVMIMEFLFSFGPLFNIKDFIAETITFDQMEYALTSCNLDSHLFDIIKFLLQTIFAYKDEEHEFRVGEVSSEKKSLLETEGIKKELGEPQGEDEAMQMQPDDKEGEKPEVEKKLDDGRLSDEEEDEMVDKRFDRRLETIKVTARAAAKWSMVTQSAHLHELILDPYTCSEVLRLHLLSSGGYEDTGEKSWFRHAHRGGYTDADDPAVELQLRRPDILDKLARVAVYDLQPADKLEVLSTLCSQLLTYSVTRDHIEVARARFKKAQRTLRELCLAEDRKKREKEQKGKKPKNQKKRKSDSLQSGEKGTTSIDAEPIGDKEQPNLQDERHQSVPVLTVTEITSTLVKNSCPEPMVTEDLVETEEETKARIERQMEELREEIHAASAVLQIVPLGTDRYHRRYWLFSCLPGLYVEHMVDIPDDSKDLLGAFDQHAAAASRDVTADKSVEAARLPGGPGGNVVSVDSSSNANVQTLSGSQVYWSCYSTEEMVQSLISVLNLRGVREYNLKAKLVAQKNIITRFLHKCPFQSSQAVEDMQESKPVSPNTASAAVEHSPKTANEFLELYLREQILDIEEKIYLGNLGHLRDVENRAGWRNIIETTGAAALATVAMAKNSASEELALSSNSGQENSPGDNRPSAEGAVCKTTVPIPQVMDPLEQLFRFLLQVQAGIEKKYLMPPLGTAVDEKHKRGSKKVGAVKDSDVCLEQWKTSLAKSTSYAQIFVHLATLERAVMWSKSLMNVRCRICRRKGGDEYMLLCDGCDHGYHMYCLRPPLVDVPEGDWFCYDCKPVTPSKTRKRTQRVPIIENSSESEEEENDEEYRSDQERSGEECSVEEEHVTARKPRRSKCNDLTEVRRSSRLQNSNEKKPEIKAKGKGPRRRVSFASEASPCSKSSSGTPPQSDSRKRPRSEERMQASPNFLSKAEGIVAAIIDLRCSQPAPKKGTSSSNREQQALELRLCEAIWDEVKNHQDSWPFSGPVKKREFPDYSDIVATPMDLRTVKNKLNAREYIGLDYFLRDMELIFSNCMLYHKRHSDIGKAGISLKKFLDKRCSDLGLHDLQLSKIDVGSRVNLRSKSGN